MAVFGAVLMIVLGVSAVVLMRKPGAGTATRTAAVVCAALALLLAFGRIFRPADASKNRLEAARSANERYEEVCGTYVGNDLGERHRDARVVILTAPQPMHAQSPIGRPALIRSLERALKGKTASVTVRALKVPEEAKAHYRMQAGGDMDPAEVQALMESMPVTDPSGWFDGPLFARLLTEFREEADVVISTVDLPVGLDARTLPPPGRAPALVLLNAWIENVQAALADTVLDAVVLQRHNPAAWKPNARIPRDPEKAFNQRYLLVTTANVDALAGQHPRL